jgi:hypothetical protein
LLLGLAAYAAAREYLLLGTIPTQLTELTIGQMQPSDTAAEALRAAETSKNWFLTGWTTLLVAGTLAACLFGGEALDLIRKFRPDADADGLSEGPAGADARAFSEGETQ